MADLKKVATDKAPPIVRATTVTRLVHRRGSLLREALCTKGLVRLRSVIPERSTKLVVITFEAQLLSKFAVLVFEFRSRLLQLAHIVRNFVNLLFDFAILQTFEQLPALRAVGDWVSGDRIGMDDRDRKQKACGAAGRIFLRPG